MGNATCSSEKSLIDLDIDKLVSRSILDGTYKARVISIYDADTLTIAMFNIHGDPELVKIRVYGIDAPEISTEIGKVAKVEAMKYLGITNDLKKNPCIINVKFIPIEDKYGRYIAKVSVEDKELSLSEYLIKNGSAVPYAGNMKNQITFGIKTESQMREQLEEMLTSNPYVKETTEEKQFVNDLIVLIRINPFKHYCNLYSYNRRKVITAYRNDKRLTPIDYVRLI